MSGPAPPVTVVVVPRERFSLAARTIEQVVNRMVVRVPRPAASSAPGQ